MQKTLGVILILASTMVSCTHDSDELVTPNDNGNNNNDTTDNNINECSPDTVYFKNDILPILQSSCGTMNCHSQESATEGVVLTNYEDIINTGDVESGRPDNSEIYERMTEPDEDDRMPPPPNERLSQEKIDKIRKWIVQGAKNNECDKEKTDKWIDNGTPK